MKVSSTWEKIQNNRTAQIEAQARREKARAEAIKTKAEAKKTKAEAKLTEQTTKIELKEKEQQIRERKAKWREEHPTFLDRTISKLKKQEPEEIEYDPSSELVTKGENGEVRMRSLENSLSVSKKERWQDYKNRVKNSWGLESAPQIREEKVSALNGEVANAFLQLKSLPREQRKETYLALLQKEGGLNKEDPMVVLMSYLVERDDYEEAELMVEHLSLENEIVFEKIASAIGENPQEITRDSFIGLEHADNNSNELLELTNLIGPALSEYDRLDGLSTSKKGAVIEMLGLIPNVNIQSPEKGMQAYRSVMQENARESLRKLNGSYEHSLAESYTMNAHTLFELLGNSINSIDEINSLSQNDKVRLTNALADTLTHERELQDKLQQRYGGIIEAVNRSEIDVYSLDQEIQDEIGMLTNLSSSISELSIVLQELAEGEDLENDQTDRINTILSHYTEGSTTVDARVTELEQTAKQKETENASIYGEVRKLALLLEEEPPVTTDALKDHVSTIRQLQKSTKQYKKTLSVPANMKKLVSLQESARKNSQQLEHFIGLSAQFEAPDSALNYYARTLMRVTENPNIIQDMEDHEFMTRELQLARQEAHRNKVIDTLFENSGATSINERTAIAAEVDNLEKGYEELPDPSDEEAVQDWLAEMFSTFGASGLESDDSLPLDEAQQMLSEAKNQKLSFLQIILLLFSSSLNENRSSKKTS